MTKRITTLLQLNTLVLLTLFLIASESNIEARPIESPIIEDPFVVLNREIDSAVSEDQISEIKINETYSSEANDTPLPSGDFFIKDYEPNKHKPLLEENPDYRGWIMIPGTAVDAPFVKSTDNDYYLKRDFYGSYSEKGTIYMDHRNIGFQFSNHAILYGHNMRDGSMFGDLDRFKDEVFAQENNIILIDDLYGTRYYQIYASYFDDADPTYITTNLDTSDMDAFVQSQLSRSDIAYGLVPVGSDKIITLITCSYEVDDGRFFVHGKEILYVPHS